MNSGGRDFVFQGEQYSGWMLSSPWVKEGMVKHTGCKKFMSFGFVILDARVSPVKSSVLNNVKVTNVNCVLHGVWGVGIEEIFIEG